MLVKKRSWLQLEDMLAIRIDNLGDPRLKLNYYKENNWERRYINSAQKLIYDVYQVEISNNENDGEDDLTSQIYKHKHIAHNSNELDLYLKDPNAQEKTDVLLW
ncbi:6720_t:CDS:2 [Entrophospora sp. SA101]|nr:6720_t:CDS:2 [Entrophospora sp. SA101]